MKRLNRIQIDRAIRMRVNGASMANIAHALGVSYETVRAALARQALANGFIPPGSNQVISPEPSELVHVGGGSPGYPGFDLLPSDADRLHEVRSANGWYGLHPEFFPSKNY